MVRNPDLFPGRAAPLSPFQVPPLRLRVRVSRPPSLDTVLHVFFSVFHERHVFPCVRPFSSHKSFNLTENPRSCMDTIMESRRRHHCPSCLTSPTPTSICPVSVSRNSGPVFRNGIKLLLPLTTFLKFVPSLFESEYKIFLVKPKFHRLSNCLPFILRPSDPTSTRSGGGTQPLTRSPDLLSPSIPSGPEPYHRCPLSPQLWRWYRSTLPVTPEEVHRPFPLFLMGTSRQLTSVVVST